MGAPAASVELAPASRVVPALENGYGAAVASERTRRNQGPGVAVPDGRHHLLIPISVLTSAALLYGFHLPYAVALVVAGVFLIARAAVAEVEPVNDPGLFEQAHGAIDRGD